MADKQRDQIRNYCNKAGRQEMPGAETKVIQGKRLDFRCTLKIETVGFVDGFSLGFSRKRGIENESEV